ncbi:hypothetical protein SUGI_0142130 [Cryptomeria japonica]|nr:hypothetical protein SUGI_0142130 [Cryptomeria japonica]
MSQVTGCILIVLQWDGASTELFNSLANQILVWIALGFLSDGSETKEQVQKLFKVDSDETLQALKIVGKSKWGAWPYPRWPSL